MSLYRALALACSIQTDDSYLKNVNGLSRLEMNAVIICLNGRSGSSAMSCGTKTPPSCTTLHSTKILRLSSIHCWMPGSSSARCFSDGSASSVLLFTISIASMAGHTTARNRGDSGIRSSDSVRIRARNLHGFLPSIPVV